MANAARRPCTGSRRSVLAAVALAAAACAGGGMEARKAMGAVAGGRFAPGHAPAARYGADPALRCPSGGAFRMVEGDLADLARAAKKPAAKGDGRLCGMAESFLGWDPSAPAPREEVVAFVSRWFGVVRPASHVMIATLETEDTRMIADRVRDAARSFAVNAAAPRFGVATQRVREGVTRVAVVLQDAPIEVDPFPRRLGAGERAPLSGRLLAGLANPQVLVSDPSGQIARPEQPPGTRFEAEIRCGDQRGRIQVEIRAEPEGARDRRVPVASFPVACATDLAASVAVAPEPWPADLEEQARRVAHLVNAERMEGGLEPLGWDDALASVARDIAATLRDEGGQAAVSVSEKLRARGIAAPVMLESSAMDVTAERAGEKLLQSPSNRANALSAEVNRIGVGIAQGKSTDGRAVVYVTELFLREQPPLDVAAVRRKLREAIAQKRRDARATAVASDPQLEEVANAYAAALAAAGGDLPKEKAAAITATLSRAFRSVSMVSGAKAEVMDFAEEPKVIAPGKLLGVGVAQGPHPVLGRNATYAVIMIGTRR